MQFRTIHNDPDVRGLDRSLKFMGCICYENPAMGICFVNDPDGYRLEVLPAKR